MNQPIDIATRETAAFVAAHVQPRASVLEVGCGAGEVSTELLARGFNVTGLDEDQAAIDQAKAQGAPVVRASWPDYACGPLDAVVFTRSLHHIHSLSDAICKARAVLRVDGRLLLEDFAFDGVDAASITWFQEVLGSRFAREQLDPGADSLVGKLLATDNPAEVWRQDHDHDLHTIEAMSGEIANHFEIEDSRWVPYFYRYLIPVLPETPEASGFVQEILNEEKRLGEIGELAPIGRRIVAVSRTEPKP